jgi:hypothetical protein
MTPNDWLLLMCLVIGWLQGLYVGWLIWRKPLLKYKGTNNT